MKQYGRKTMNSIERFTFVLAVLTLAGPAFLLAVALARRFANWLFGYR